MLLKNKKAIITGASTGLGKVIAENFIKEGANIIICARNPKNLSDSVEYLKSFSNHTNQTIESIVCDISNYNELDNFFPKAIDRLNGLDILVNNAGIYGPIGSSEEIDIHLWEESIKINLLGPFRLCQLAITYFKSKKAGKIINLSGGGATSPLPNISSYASSKAAIVRLTETLAQEVNSYGIEINAIAPGALNTRLLDQVLEAGSDKVGSEFYQRAIRQKEDGGAPLDEGAKLCIYLASDRCKGVNGKLISAIWDSWDTLTEDIEKSSSFDIYTLRRIIPKDRGEDW